jgi:hypothetical protein
MWEDPIVKETRAAGAKLLEACGWDMRKLAERLRAGQSQHAERVVHDTHHSSPRPRVPTRDRREP